jgi:hypothetical protein
MQQNEYDDWNTFQIFRPDRENIDWDVFWMEILVEIPIFLLVVFAAVNLFRIWLGLSVMNLKTAAQLTGVIPDKETDELNELIAALEKEEKAQKAQRKPKRRYEVVSAYNEEHKIEDDFGFDD